jgi:hypothetical protein
VVSYAVTLDVPRELILFVSGLLAAPPPDRDAEGNRRLGCYRQALFGLAWCRDRCGCGLVFVGAGGVVAGAELAVAGGRCGEQVPDDHQDGAGDGDQGLELAAAPDDPPVAFAGEVSVRAVAAAASPRMSLR